MKILINHTGYYKNELKKLIIQGSRSDPPKEALITEKASGKMRKYKSITEHGTVSGWKTGYYYSLDFSDLKKPGE